MIIAAGIVIVASAVALALAQRAARIRHSVPRNRLGLSADDYNRAKPARGL
jgi:hypothetical protein